MENKRYNPENGKGKYDMRKKMNQGVENLSKWKLNSQLENLTQYNQIKQMRIIKK